VASTKNKLLYVYIYNKFAGVLFFEQGNLSFQYDNDYLHNEKAKPLSYSMPLYKEAYGHKIVEPFFSGLLPEEGIRRKIAKYLHISTQNTFGLLKAIGGECAGAISLQTEKHGLYQDQEYKILTNEESYELLSHLDKRPMLVGEKDIRISGAGAQDKLIISIIDNKIAIPLKNTPSSYIIKPEIEGFTNTVENEYFCMTLARKIGLPVPETTIYRLKDKNFYLVARYDRKILKDGDIQRLHQEDFCQALNIPPIQKYENEGGPGLKQCFELLDNKIKNGLMAGENKLILLKGIIFNYLIGNRDAHGKNFSILYEDDSESLSPFYDLLCTCIYTGLHKTKMAMKIGGKYKFEEINTQQFEKLSNDIGFRFDFVKKQIIDITKKLNIEAKILIEQLNNDKRYNNDIYQSIINVIEENSKRLTLYEVSDSKKLK